MKISTANVAKLILNLHKILSLNFQPANYYIKLICAWRCAMAFLPPLDSHKPRINKIWGKFGKPKAASTIVARLDLNSTTNLKAELGFGHCEFIVCFICNSVVTKNSISSRSSTKRRPAFDDDDAEQRRRRLWLRFCAFCEQMKIETIANGKAGRSQSRTKNNPKTTQDDAKHHDFHSSQENCQWRAPKKEKCGIVKQIKRNQPYSWPIVMMTNTINWFSSPFRLRYCEKITSFCRTRLMSSIWLRLRRFSSRLAKRASSTWYNTSSFYF